MRRRRGQRGAHILRRLSRLSVDQSKCVERLLCCSFLVGCIGIGVVVTSCCWSRSWGGRAGRQSTAATAAIINANNTGTDTALAMFYLQGTR